MSTQVAAVATPETSVPTKARKERKTFSYRLDGQDGATLRVVLSKKKDGSATTHVVHGVKVGKKRVNERGATEKHPDVATGENTVEKIVAAALKLGWVRRERKSGFTAKPDSFTAKNLPAPTPAKAKK